jgi:predicted RNA binding protein YcfA (HicA-like mRNA interferase family)
LKRKDVIRHLESNGCEFLREGASHTVYANRMKKKVSTVPRHREVDENLVTKICKDLEIPKP